MTDQFRRAVLAFPDEDVLVGTRFADRRRLRGVQDASTTSCPGPTTRPRGEERAWGRRLAKRFGVETGDYDDRTFIAKGDGTLPVVLDHESLKPEKLDRRRSPPCSPASTPSRGDSLIAFGWAMAEDLMKLVVVCATRGCEPRMLADGSASRRLVMVRPAAALVSNGIGPGRGGTQEPPSGTPRRRSCRSQRTFIGAVRGPISVPS